MGPELVAGVASDLDMLITDPREEELEWTKTQHH
jgi:hypothetical protein